MSKRHVAAVALSALFLALPFSASALTLELALVIDGSGSISGPNGSLTNPSNRTTPPDYGDWGLQLDAYRNVFTNQFYSNIVQGSIFDTVQVAAFFFSGGGQVISDPNNTPNDPSDDVVVAEYSLYSFIDWSPITDDASAAAFGAQFDKETIPHPGGSTATAEAIDVAVNGGLVGCPFAQQCNPVAAPMPPFANSVQGLLNNGVEGDVLIIDISTDGVPTEPNGNGQPNQADRDLAIAAANNARNSIPNVIINALGVGNVDPVFLDALVGINPAASPQGFVELAQTFDEFESTLLNKLTREINIPLPATLPLFLSGLFGWGFWQRRQRTQS